MNRSRIFKIILFLLYLAAVAWLCFGSFKPSPKIPRSFMGYPIDKVIHFLMFLPFPVLGALAFDFRSWWRALSISTLMGNIIAFSFEHLQGRITKIRVTDPSDLNANFLGITVGIVIAVIIGLLARKK